MQFQYFFPSNFHNILKFNIEIISSSSTESSCFFFQPIKPIANHLANCKHHFVDFLKCRSKERRAWSNSLFSSRNVNFTLKMKEMEIMARFPSKYVHCSLVCNGFAKLAVQSQLNEIFSTRITKKKKIYLLSKMLYSSGLILNRCICIRSSADIPLNLSMTWGNVPLIFQSIPFLPLQEKMEIKYN